MSRGAMMSSSATAALSGLVNLNCSPVQWHRSLKSSQSGLTQNPADLMSNLPLLLTLNPRNCSSFSFANGTFHLSRRWINYARAISLSVGSLLLSLLSILHVLVAMYFHSMFGTPNPPSLRDWKIMSLVFSLVHFLTCRTFLSFNSFNVVCGMWRLANRCWILASAISVMAFSSIMMGKGLKSMRSSLLE